jgi:hypothetical protein
MRKPLTRVEKAKIDEAKESLCPGDLYSALHRVGDDPVKSEIEDVLERALDEDAFKTVVAIFKVATSD